MNLKSALALARETLQKKDIPDAALEGEILLRHVAGISRAHLFAHPEEEIDSNKEAGLKRALARRLKGEPTAYITGHREFYGLDFVVNRDVLIPRPETELLVEKAIALAKIRPTSTIADIGTGSGAIAVSLAVNILGVTVYATDISAGALKVAVKNVRKHNVTGRVILFQGEMLGPLPGPIDMIVANLPYVKAGDLPEGGPLSHEPRLALYGGEDGLDSIKAFCEQAGGKLNPQGYLLLEIGQGQAKSARDMLNTTFPGGLIQTYRDVAGIERVVSLYLT